MTSPDRLLFERRDRGWVRAPAAQDGDDIVLDMAEGVSYAPFNEPDLPYQLAKIQTPTDAVAFASTFGLIGRYPFTGAPEVPTDRQAFREFELAALWIRDLLGVTGAWSTATGRRSTSRQRATAVTELRQWALNAPAPTIYQLTAVTGLLASPGHLVSLSEQARDSLKAPNDNDFLDGVTAWLADALTSSTALIPHKVGVGARHRFRHEYGEGFTLVDTACLHIASRVIDQKEIRRCLDCRHYFPLDDRRQRFCNSTCASRARKRRLRAEQKRQVNSSARRRRS
jgi:hypothetical protein